MNTATATATDTDRIERSIRIDATRARVWRALASPEEFGSWFGARLQGQAFAPGQRVQGPMTACGHEHIMFDAIVERVEPEKLMSFRWHPYAVDAAVDYSKEQRTLVTFTLQDADAGTLLTVVESGFDAVPAHRRLEAFRMNTGGWEVQLQNIARHAASR